MRPTRAPGRASIRAQRTSTIGLREASRLVLYTPSRVSINFGRSVPILTQGFSAAR